MQPLSPASENHSTQSAGHPSNGLDTLGVAVDNQAILADGLAQLLDRLDSIEARMGDLDARLYAALGQPYPAGPFGLQCFKNEGEARLAWALLQRLLGHNEPFPTLARLAGKQTKPRVSMGDAPPRRRKLEVSL